MSDHDHQPKRVPTEPATHAGAGSAVGSGSPLASARGQAAQSAGSGQSVLSGRAPGPGSAPDTQLLSEQMSDKSSSGDADQPAAGPSRGTDKLPHGLRDANAPGAGDLEMGLRKTTPTPTRTIAPPAESLVGAAAGVSSLVSSPVAAASVSAAAAAAQIRGGAPAADDLVGVVLNERYALQAKLGQGGMGSVYLAEHALIQKRFAVKVLGNEFALKPDLVERFLQEARAASRIDQENVVEITDYGNAPGGTVFFVMEYLEGEDLACTLKNTGPMPWPRVKAIMLQICRALQAAHDVGIIHRDMKPENCFRSARGRNPDFIKVLDFGIAKVTGPDVEEGGKGLTRTGMIFGTPEYMSPEQAHGLKPDHRVDIYSTGVIMYELLTGRVPFTGNTFMSILTKHMLEEPTPPSQVDPKLEIPGDVEALVLKALQKQADDRFSSMDEMAMAIEACGETMGYQPPGFARPGVGAGVSGVAASGAAGQTSDMGVSYSDAMLRSGAHSASMPGSLGAASMPVEQAGIRQQVGVRFGSVMLGVGLGLVFILAIGVGLEVLKPELLPWKRDGAVESAATSAPASVSEGSKPTRRPEGAPTAVPAKATPPDNPVESPAVAAGSTPTPVTGPGSKVEDEAVEPAATDRSRHYRIRTPVVATVHDAENDEILGRTNGKVGFDLPPGGGAREVKLRAPGYKDRVVTLPDGPPGGVVSREFNLEKLPDPVAEPSSDAGAKKKSASSGKDGRRRKRAKKRSSASASSGAEKIDLNKNPPKKSKAAAESPAAKTSAGGTPESKTGERPKAEPTTKGKRAGEAKKSGSRSRQGIDDLKDPFSRRRNRNR